MLHDDTIAAISSAPGSALRGIIRLSGPQAWPLAQVICSADIAPQANQLRASTLKLLGLPVLLLFFCAPRSFTGEDIAELHVPGSPALLTMVMDKLLLAGARQARPGEFTARAFFHGKMDLTQAEGVAATIAAESSEQLRAAASLREGDLHRRIAQWSEALADMLARVEAGIDFSDEEGVQFIAPAQVAEAVRSLGQEMRDAVAQCVRADRLGGMPTVVFVGEPNVGKSSLINVLAGRERAIVSPVAGTTRDALSLVMDTATGPVRLVDVPGDETTADALRQQMMGVRDRAMLEADLVVEVRACGGNGEDGAREVRAFGAQAVVIHNKCDLMARYEADGGQPCSDAWRRVSAKTGENIATLQAAIGGLVAVRSSMGQSQLALTTRHREILYRASLTLRALGERIADAEAGTLGSELVAAELRQALDLLGEITGMISADEILGKIFSKFCIGK